MDLFFLSNPLLRVRIPIVVVQLAPGPSNTLCYKYRCFRLTLNIKKAKPKMGSLNEINYLEFFAFRILKGFVMPILSQYLCWKFKADHVVRLRKLYLWPYSAW
jgi:hypothetical protein